MSLLAQTESQLNVTTRRTMRENEQVILELEYQSREVESTMDRMLAVQAENQRLRRELELEKGLVLELTRRRAEERRSGEERVELGSEAARVPVSGSKSPAPRASKTILPPPSPSSRQRGAGPLARARAGARMTRRDPFCLSPHPPEAALGSCRQVIETTAPRGYVVVLVRPSRHT